MELTVKARPPPLAVPPTLGTRFAGGALTVMPSRPITMSGSAT